MSLLYRLILSLFLATGLVLSACAVDQDDDPDTTIVNPAAEPDINIDAPDAPDVNIDAPEAPEVDVETDN